MCTHCSSSASFPTFMWGRCLIWVDPILSSLALPPWQFSLRQVIPDAIQTPPPRPSSSYFPWHLHHCFDHIFFFSSQYMPIPPQPTSLHYLGYFSHLCCPSNSFIPYSVQFRDSKNPHFHRMQLLLLCFLYCLCLGAVHHWLSCSSY